MSRFTVQLLGSYSLASRTTFLESFASFAYNGGEMEMVCHLASIADGTEQAARVCLHVQSRPSII